MSTPIGAKRRAMCQVCREPTTQKFGRLSENDEPRWLCYMHDLNPKSPDEVERIMAERRAKRKGWQY